MPGLYLPLSDLAKIYHVHPRTARRWAAEDKWRRTGTKPVRYHLGDAQASYEQRHAGRVVSHLAAQYGAGAD